MKSRYIICGPDNKPGNYLELAHVAIRDAPGVKRVNGPTYQVGDISAQNGNRPVKVSVVKQNLEGNFITCLEFDCDVLPLEFAETSIKNFRELVQRGLSLHGGFYLI